MVPTMYKFAHKMVIGVGKNRSPIYFTSEILDPTLGYGMLSPVSTGFKQACDLCEHNPYNKHRIHWSLHYILSMRLITHESKSALGKITDLCMTMVWESFDDFYIISVYFEVFLNGHIVWS